MKIKICVSSRLSMERKSRWIGSNVSPLKFCGLNVDNMQLDFSHDGFIETMKLIEKKHWNYLDNHCSRFPSLPRLNFFKFMEELFVHKKCESEVPNVKEYYKRYDKYKKSLPTSGAAVLYDSYYILLVKVNGSPVFSIPKGKTEHHESMEDTAIREVKEETGLDLSPVIRKSTPDMHVHVRGTRFYIVESDVFIRDFRGYNRNEISCIKWFDFETILKKPTTFSKQTKTMIHKLLSMNYLR